MLFSSIEVAPTHGSIFYKIEAIPDERPAGGAMKAAAI
jgi:hypothetical protein